MTLTLELTPETEAWLAQEAGEHGLDTPTYVVQLIERHKPQKSDWHQLTPEQKEARVDAITGRGKYAHILSSVDDYLRRKQDEIDHEEERSRRRMRQQP